MVVFSPARVLVTLALALMLIGCGNASISQPEPACASVVCDAPPLPACDGDTRVSFSGSFCDPETETCVYTRLAVDCTIRGEACLDGECVPADEVPCDPSRCVDPPPPVCDGDAVVVFGSPGTCASPEGPCTYPEIDRLDCAMEGLVCEDGRCVPPGSDPSGEPTGQPSDAPSGDPSGEPSGTDRCVGVSCPPAPASVCDGTVAVRHDVSASGCDPATGLCVWTEDTRWDCAEFGFTCLDGDCIDPAVTGPCAGRDLCPPGAADVYCEDASTLVICVEDDDGCRVRAPESCAPTEACATEPGGDELACVFVDRCEGVVCDNPPAARCEGSEVVTFGADGSCDPETGRCDYPSEREACGGEEPLCALVEQFPICVGRCFGVVCDTPPEDTCDGDEAVRFDAESGVCDASTGACSFEEERELCEGETAYCLAGACLAIDCMDPDNCVDERCALSPVCGFGVNFDFEDWSTSDPPPGFVKAPASSFVVEESDQAVTGERGARLTSTVSDNRDLQSEDWLEAEGGATYTFHVWVRIDVRPGTQWVRLGLTWFDGSGERIGNRDFGPLFDRTTSGWEEIVHASTAPVVSPVELKPFLRVQARGNWSVLTDAWAVTRPVAFDVDAPVDASALPVAGEQERMLAAGVNNAGQLYVSGPAVSGGESMVLAWVGGVAAGGEVTLPGSSGVTVPAPASGGRLVAVVGSADGCTVFVRDGSAWTERTGAVSCGSPEGRLTAVLGLPAILGSASAAAVPGALGLLALTVEGEGVVAATGTGEPVQGSVVPREAVLGLHRAAILVGRQ